jgi:hypothetical protein
MPYYLCRVPACLPVRNDSTDDENISMKFGTDEFTNIC